MLSRNQRLRDTNDIRDVLRRGVCVTAPSVRLCALPGRGRGAVIVGKKVHKKAIARHRYQRWLRILLREFLSENGVLLGYDLVWVGRAGLLKYKKLADVRLEIIEAVTRLMRKLNNF